MPNAPIDIAPQGDIPDPDHSTPKGDVTEADKLRPIRRTLTGVLIFQLVLAGLLFLGDIGRDFSLPRSAPNAPGFDRPIQPGDQTRRFTPDLPAGPGVDTGPMPERLVLDQIDGATYLLTGSIAKGDADRLIPQLRATQITTLLLHSPGGIVSDALRLGRAIRAAGIDTHMRDNDVCLSACPYMLASGTKRSADPEARIGVHQHYYGENTFLPAFLAVEDIQFGQAEVMRFLNDMGVDPMLTSHAMATPPRAIYLLNRDELNRYNLLTE